MDEASREKLWQEYSLKHSVELKNILISEYIYLIKFVAGRLSMYLGSNVEYDDLMSYGVFGLIDAIDKFELEKGVKFDTYASLRIRGAILDSIRKMDWIPRSLRKRQKQIDHAFLKFESEFGREPSDIDMANELGISEDEFLKWNHQISALNLVSLDDFNDTNGEKSYEPASHHSYGQPEVSLEKEELKRILIEALDGLNENEKKVISLYYYDELTLKEISYVLSVSESRISQIHTKALMKMRKLLGKHADSLF